MGLKKHKGTGLDYIESIAANPLMRRHYEPLVKACEGKTLKAFLFGILTANEETGRAECGLESLEKHGFPRDEFTIARVMRSAGCMFYNSKARRIARFLAEWDADSNVFEPKRFETCAQYRDRLLARGVPGLGFTKLSFACYLAYGGGNVICPDRHIIRVYTGRLPDKDVFTSKKGELFLRQIEAHFVSLADKYGWASASALQWAVWCECINEPFDHAVVAA